jgi:pilus assembly protein CpaB
MRAAVIGVVVAGVTSFLVWSYMRRFEEEASGGPKIQVLTVSRTLETGAVLKDADIGERAIPQAYVDSRVIRATERQRIANLHLSNPVDAQQILNWSDIVGSNDERDMATRVQPNMRAVVIHIDTRASAMVRPGDRVDVIATLLQPGSNDHKTAVMLLQNVLVLGRTSTGGGAMTSGEGSTVLSLSPHDAQLLSVAADKAKLTIALRSIEDVRIQDSPGEVNSTSIAEQPQRVAPAKAKAPPVALGGK